VSLKDYRVPSAWEIVLVWAFPMHFSLPRESTELLLRRGDEILVRTSFSDAQESVYFT
jgi:hypothetical protein